MDKLLKHSASIFSTELWGEDSIYFKIILIHEE